MATVTLDQMRSKLLTLDQVATVLSTTEPLASQQVEPNSSKVKFSMDDGWNADLDAIAGTDEVAVMMRINGTERPMTKDAALLAAANVGLPGAYVKRTPAKLIEPHLNYWYGPALTEDKAFTALTVNDRIAAFTRPTLVPFSNMALLEAVTAGIRKQYGEDTEILADYKIRNSLLATDVRLIIPEQQHTIVNGGMTDVPSGQADLWSAGVHLSNSLIGKRQTGVETYLFRWWCTNGETSTMGDVGTWSRRTSGQDADVYVWAREAVDEILGGMEHKFAEVQALTDLSVAGNVADILRDIFIQHEVPVSQRGAITASLLEAETLTMYTIMNAITQTANDPDLSPDRADRMMRIGGQIPTATFDTIKAKVWAEGHEAEPEKPNPYLIGALN